MDANIFTGIKKSLYDNISGIIREAENILDASFAKYPPLKDNASEWETIQGKDENSLELEITKTFELPPHEPRKKVFSKHFREREKNFMWSPVKRISFTSRRWKAVIYANNPVNAYNPDKGIKIKSISLSKRYYEAFKYAYKQSCIEIKNLINNYQPLS